MVLWVSLARTLTMDPLLCLYLHLKLCPLPLWSLGTPCARFPHRVLCVSEPGIAFSPQAVPPARHILPFPSKLLLILQNPAQVSLLGKPS